MNQVYVDTVALLALAHKKDRHHQKAVSVYRSLIKEGQSLFISRKDKSWSLVDCIGMNIARHKGISQIFTADKHFEQAGFENLL